MARDATLPDPCRSLPRPCRAGDCLACSAAHMDTDPCRPTGHSQKLSCWITKQTGQDYDVGGGAPTHPDPLSRV